MKRIFWIIPAILLFTITSHAQDTTPAWDVAGTFTYLKADLSHGNFNLLGATASSTENLNNWVGGRIEISAFHGTEAGATVSAQTVTYGPVFSYRHFNGFTPYVHVQAGAIHASQGYLGISESAIKFAMVAGGGVDVRVSHVASVRLQADYMMSRFLSLNQNNLEGSVGVVFRFGEKKPHQQSGF